MAENPRIEELRRRVQLDPASIAFAALAEEFRRMGRHEEAIETCRAGLQRHPAYLSARVTLGRALIETGDYDAARAELETVLRSAPENLAAIRGLAQIHERLGQSTEMDPHFAAMMNAEVERVALAAAAAPSPAPPAPPVPPPPAAPAAPDPLLVAAAELAIETSQAAVAETEPAEPEPSALVAHGIEVVEAEPEPAPEPELDLSFEEPVHSGPDPVMLATLARLERFLVAIDTARHP
jgi:tetratricopeptide (TPR) repeat protein